MSHDHSHDHRAPEDRVKPLAVTLVLVLVYMAVEVVGGILSGSLALLADAGHMLSDAGALALTLFAMRFARKPATATRTYGYYRAEILAALVNGATLLAIAVFIFIEAYERLTTPPEIDGALMLTVGAGGLAVNVAGLWILSADRNANLNIRGAWLHVLTDAVGSLQAIGAGLLIWAFHWNWTDPLASVLIGLLVMYSSWSLLRQSVAVLMEGAPGHIDVDQVRTALLELSGVSSVHDLHIWTITSGFVALSAHLTCVEVAAQSTVLHAAQHVLSDRFGIRHTTIQFDRESSCDRAEHLPA